MMDAFANFIYQRIGYLGKVHPHKSIFRIRYKGVELPQSIVAVLYGGAAICLDRKNAIAKEILRATPKRQNRTGRQVKYRGKLMRISELAKFALVSEDVLRERVARGDLSIADCLKRDFNWSRRNVRFRGRTQTVAAWATELGVTRGMVYQRLNRGQSIRKALTTNKKS